MSSRTSSAAELQGASLIILGCSVSGNSANNREDWEDSEGDWEGVGESRVFLFVRTGTSCRRRVVKILQARALSAWLPAVTCRSFFRHAGQAADDPRQHK